MRPEVRAEYLRAAEHVRGRRPVRDALERFFTELRDPLAALYGDDAASRPLFDALLAAIARDRRGARPRAARASTTSARSRPTGCIATRPSAT